MAADLDIGHLLWGEHATLPHHGGIAVSPLGLALFEEGIYHALDDVGALEAFHHHRCAGQGDGLHPVSAVVKPLPLLPEEPWQLVQLLCQGHEPRGYNHFHTVHLVCR